MNFLYEYEYYIIMGLVFFAILYAVQQGMWVLCALEPHCHQQYLNMISGS